MTMDIDTLFAAAIARDSDALEKLATIADHPSEDEENGTILHIACKDGHTERVKFMVTEFANKSLLVKVNKYKQTPLHFAAGRGYSEVVEILIDAARRIWPSSATADDDPYNSPSAVKDFLRQADSRGNTALHLAVYRGVEASVELLVNADRNDRHIQNHKGETPMYAAVARGQYDIVKLICKTCTAPSLDGPQGTTALHLAIRDFREANGSDNYFKDLFERTDLDNQTLLSLAMLKNHPDVVRFILHEDPAYQHLNKNTSKYSDLKSLMSTASREGYKDIVQILFAKYESGDNNDYTCHRLLIEAIEGGERELVHDLLEYNKYLVIRTSNNWTALHYAVSYKFNQVIDAIVSAQEDVCYKMDECNIESPLILAANKGFTSTLVLLMNLLPANLCVARDVKCQNILHIAVVQRDKRMIHNILAYCPRSCMDELLNAKDEDGNTPLHLLIAQGFFVPELIKHISVDVVAKNKQNWTPSDMLYFQEEITDEQARIKTELDDIQDTQQKQFWRINIRGRWNNVASVVPRSRRLLKDIEFEIKINEMMEKEHEQRKEKVKPYRERTTTQIIVTALITTVTFTVGFTMPGGYHQSGEPEEGLVLLSKKKAFEVFMISDASALALSITSLFIYFISSMYDDPDQVSKFDAASTGLNIVSVIAMILTFIAGIYVVLSHSPGLALIVCVICSTFFISLIVLLIKMMYDWKRSRKIKV
ncbi:protein ACCELERATED CELL DEATH 6-like isoform X2 [Apium graveolens]|uniref:protein ACCELERATED CELL DEATH 6-like isoform X2 n=1 Tax=Apium graveolens TaxID=4045 RepID=UPI003D7BEBEF